MPWPLQKEVRTGLVCLLDTDLTADLFRDLIKPPQNIPMARTMSFLRGAESLSPLIPTLEKETVAQVSGRLQNLFSRTYPYRMLQPETGRRSPVHSLLQRFHFQAQSEGSHTLKVTHIESSGSHQALVSVRLGDETSQWSVSTGCETLSEENSLNTSVAEYVPTPDCENTISAMIHDHSLGQDFCLVGSKSSGKTVLIQEFARRLGYRTEGMLLFRDMTSRDLLLRRVTKPSLHSGAQDTSWEYSPLLRAAMEGHIAILDNIDRLPPTTLTTLASLIQDREVSLFNGERLVSSSRFEELKSSLGLTDEQLRERGIIGIHPSFRIIATSLPVSLSDDHLELFHYHEISPLTTESAQTVLSTLVPGCDLQLVEKLVHLSQRLRSSEAHLNMNFGFREIHRVLQKVMLHSTPEDRNSELCKSLMSSCLASFAPESARTDFLSLLSSIGLPNQVQSQVVSFDLGKQLPDRFHLERASNPTDPSTVHLIPSVVFYDNATQLEVLQSLSAELALGQHVLLIGNQGVGKNKLCDHLLQKLNLPRQYVQLHRDVTVQSLTSQNTLRDGGLHLEDSPLITALREGQVLVVDEADKAPREVVCILKGLIDGELVLPDGRQVVKQFSAISKKSPNDPRLIPIHQNFRMIVLANKPNWPFQGNDFYAECGELFSCHPVSNPSKESQLEILKNYAPQVNHETLQAIVNAFDELRSYAEHGITAYPYSTRECVSVAKHLAKFPEDSISHALSNVLAFDALDSQAKNYIVKAFLQYGIPVDRSILDVGAREVVNQLSSKAEELRMWVDYDGKREASSPKHGKEDPDNQPHVGGNTWAGGTGGADTAGLGGKGGPYRLDKGHTVHQISEQEKRAISKESLDAARKMGEEALRKRLVEIDMDTRDAHQYEQYLHSVRTEVDQLRMIMEAMKSKGKERVWVHNKSSGDLDDTKLVDALAGDK